MAEKTESKLVGSFILHELPHDFSRANVTVLSGQNLARNAVLGRVSIGVGKADIPAVVGTGNGLMSALFGGPDVEKGSYVVTCKTAVANGGVFSVVAPSGKALPDATVATPYRSSHINFLISDGSTDFIVGDVFTIVVTTGAPAVVGTGNGTISGLSLGPDAKPGQYRVENIEAIVNGGRFKVVGPDGDEIAIGSIVAGVGGTLVLANQRQLNLTITDAATDFAVGDFFEVFAFNEGERGLGKAVVYDPLTFDGRHRVAGILLDAVDATAGDKKGVAIVREAVIQSADVAWAAAVTTAQQQAAKAEMERNLRIIAR